MVLKASRIYDQKLGKYCHKKYRSVSLFSNLKSKVNIGTPSTFAVNDLNHI